MEYTAPIHFKVKWKVKNLDKKSEKMSVLYFDERSFDPEEYSIMIYLLVIVNVLLLNTINQKKKT